MDSYMGHMDSYMGRMDSYPDRMDTCPAYSCPRTCTRPFRKLDTRSRLAATPCPHNDRILLSTGTLFRLPRLRSRFPWHPCPAPS